MLLTHTSQNKASLKIEKFIVEIVLGINMYISTTCRGNNFIDYKMYKDNVLDNVRGMSRCFHTRYMKKYCILPYPDRKQTFVD